LSVLVAAALVVITALAFRAFRLCLPESRRSITDGTIRGAISTCKFSKGGRLEAWGRPILAMAPMVGQSDYPFRVLCRRHGTTVCWTEMLMADTFVSDANYRIQALGREGVRADDHPLVVQFAANTPKDFCAAALLAEELGADAVDLNLVSNVCEHAPQELRRLAQMPADGRSTWA